MIDEFVDSVLIIDDSEDEVQKLKELFEEKDIWVTYINPPKEKQDFDKIKPYRNRRLIFLDLRLDETKKTIENISVIIRPLLSKIISKDFGSYGIVMWTKHENHIDEFKRKIENDSSLYQLPLFVIQMDKTKYLRYGYENILNDLKSKITDSVAAHFFVQWSNLIKKGKDESISSIFKLIPSYQKQDKNLEFILFKLAQNNTGIPYDKIDENYPISIDAVKAFNKILISNINSITNGINLIGDKNKISFINNDGNITAPNTKIDSISGELLELYSKLNLHLFIDKVNILQEKIIPGNIYEIIDAQSKLKHPNLPADSKPIIIEMTPPCDFAQSRITFPRVLSGYICKYDREKVKKLKDNCYKELWPLQIDSDNKMVVFDFSILGFVDENELKDASKYKLLFQAKDTLFADILQKMSSHNSRLGLSKIK